MSIFILETNLNRVTGNFISEKLIILQTLEYEEKKIQVSKNSQQHLGGSSKINWTFILHFPSSRSFKSQSFF